MAYDLHSISIALAEATGVYTITSTTSSGVITRTTTTVRLDAIADIDALLARLEGGNATVPQPAHITTIPDAFDITQLTIGRARNRKFSITGKTTDLKRVSWGGTNWVNAIVAMDRFLDRLEGVTVTPPPPRPIPVPVNTVAPAISGTVSRGSTLAASQGTWDNTPEAYAYQWQRCDGAGASCVSIAGAVGSTYNVTDSDIGSTLKVRVTASNVSGDSLPAYSAATIVVPVPPIPVPVNSVLPAVSGTVASGNVLTATSGTWANTPTSYAYQWERCNTSGASCVLISGATSSTYTVTTEDIGSTLRCRVTATNASGSGTPASSTATITVPPLPVPAPVISVSPVVSGTIQDTKTIACSTGTWQSNPTGYTYQWQRCNASGASCVNIGGATSSFYTVQTADVGGTLRCTVTATNASGAQAASSAATAVVAAAPGAPAATKHYGIVRLGTSYAAAAPHAANYGLVCVGVSDVAAAAALPSTIKRCVYLATSDCMNFFTGVTQSYAKATPGFILGDRIGSDANQDVNGYILDIGLPAVQARFVSEVSAYLTAHGLDGFYVDNFVSDISTLMKSGTMPAKYPTVKAWHDNALIPFLVNALGALKTAGFYVGANIIPWFPRGDQQTVYPGTDQNNGTTHAAMFGEAAPYLSWAMLEDGFRPNGFRRKEYDTNPQWPAYWSGFRNLVSVVEAAGCHLWITANSTIESDLIYVRAAFETLTNGINGGVLCFGGTADPWTTGTWTKDLGTASGAGTKVSHTYARTFASGSVSTDPYAGTATIS